MDTYNITAVKSVLSHILQANITTEAWSWFNAQSDADNTPAFSKAFVMMPRKTGKAVLEVGETQQQALANLRPGFTLPVLTKKHRSISGSRAWRKEIRKVT